MYILYMMLISFANGYLILRLTVGRNTISQPVTNAQRAVNSRTIKSFVVVRPTKTHHSSYRPRSTATS